MGEERLTSSLCSHKWVVIGIVRFLKKKIPIMGETEAWNMEKRTTGESGDPVLVLGVPAEVLVNCRRKKHITMARPKPVKKHREGGG